MWESRGGGNTDQREYQIRNRSGTDFKQESGDTIRVSLTVNLLEEIKIRKLIFFVPRTSQRGVEVVSCPI